MKAGRKKHGEGKHATQKAKRRDLASHLVCQLQRVLDIDHVQDTGTLFPRCVHLRKTKNRIFTFLRTFKGRIFTRKLCQSVCRKLLLRLAVPLDPQKDIKEIANIQALRLQKLARRAKRLSMEGDTVPYVTSLKYIFLQIEFFEKEN